MTAFDASPSGSRAELAAFLRKNRRALGLGRPEIWGKGAFDSNYDEQPQEAMHTFGSRHGKIFTLRMVGAILSVATLDFRILAA